MKFSDINSYRFFLALHRHQKLLPAAQFLGVEHSTVKRRIDQLEKDLGHRLFSRVGHNRTLTRAGKKILPLMLELETTANKLDNLSSSEIFNPKGVVKLAAIESLASEWLAPNLSKLIQNLPNLELEVQTGGSVVNLAQGDYDIAIRSPRPTQAGLLLSKLAEVHFHLYGSMGAEEYISIGDDKSLQVKGRPKLYCFAPDQAVLQKISWFSELQTKCQLVLCTNSTLMIARACKSSKALVVLPRFIGDNIPNLYTRPNWVVSKQLIWLVRNPLSKSSAMITKFIQELKRVAHTGDHRLY